MLIVPGFVDGVSPRMVASENRIRISQMTHGMNQRRSAPAEYLVMH